MQKQLVITIIGPDRPGIVDLLAEQVQAAGGNWLASSMSELAGQFAGILHITLPAERETDLRQALAALPNLTITLAEGIVPPPPGPQLMMTVTGNDRPGIVHELAATLHRLGVSVVDLTTGCEPAPHSGAPLFYAHTLIALPDDLTTESLIQALESLSDDLMIDIDQDLPDALS